MDTATLMALALSCAPQVDSTTALALVAVESGANPHAIGVVGGALRRQPRDRGEAMATARHLEAQGWNFSVGLAQINRSNFKGLGISMAGAFEPCENLRAMQALLVECYERANRTPMGQQRALRQALSCYYSGNFVTGFRHGYVSRVVAASLRAASRPAPLPTRAKESP